MMPHDDFDWEALRQSSMPTPAPAPAMAYAAPARQESQTFTLEDEDYERAPSRLGLYALLGLSALVVAALATYFIFQGLATPPKEATTFRPAQQAPLNPAIPEKNFREALRDIRSESEVVHAVWRDTGTPTLWVWLDPDAPASVSETICSIAEQHGISGCSIRYFDSRAVNEMRPTGEVRCLE